MSVRKCLSKRQGRAAGCCATPASSWCPVTQGRAIRSLYLLPGPRERKETADALASPATRVARGPSGYRGSTPLAATQFERNVVEIRTPFTARAKFSKRPVQTGFRGRFHLVLKRFRGTATNSKEMTRDEHNSIANVTLVCCIFVVEDAVIPCREGWFPALTYVSHVLFRF